MLSQLLWSLQNQSKETERSQSFSKSYTSSSWITFLKCDITVSWPSILKQMLLIVLLFATDTLRRPLSSLSPWCLAPFPSDGWPPSSILFVWPQLPHVHLLQLGLPVASLVLYLGLRIQHPQLLPSEQCRVIGKIFWQFLPGQGSQGNLLGLSEWPHPTHWEPERVRCCFRLSSFDNQAPHFVSEVTEI